MTAYSIPDLETLQREIRASHERCRQFGVDPNDTCNLFQKRLKPDELAVRLEQNRDFLEIATAQIGELYQFVAGAGLDFIDREVFIRALSRSMHLICTAKPIVFIDQRITGLQSQ
jgi:hypothetical protein